MHPELYILRHGETVWNAEGRLQGAQNSDLTPRGRAQAADQGRILARCGALAHPVFASPLGRVAETARIALESTAIIPRVDPRLREISLGAWEGMTRTEIGRLRPDLAPRLDSWALYDLAPEGEGLAALRARAAAFLGTLDGPSVLFTHGITSRVLRTVAMGLPLEAAAELPGGQGIVYHVKSGCQAVLEP